MSVPATTTTLTELAAHQQSRKTFAFSFGEEDRRLARLRAVHAKKTAELNAFGDLYEETAPDFILRTADGRELILRLPTDDARSLCCTLREVLETEIRLVEEKIIDYLLEEQAEAEVLAKKPQLDADLRPAILALCQPTTTTVVAQHNTSPVAPAGQLQATTTLPLDAAA